MDEITQKNAAAYDSEAASWNEKFSRNVWYKYLERPAMRQLLPQDLEHKSVLCIGVGSGDELVELIKQNPRRILAIDISQKFLDIVRKKFPSVEVVKMDMMDLEFPPDSFDLVYSSLAFHYARDWDELMQKIYAVLRRGGKLLFSTHHPKFWGTKEKLGETVNGRGVVLTMHKSILHAGVEAVYYNHANTEVILDSVRRAGFNVIQSLTPKPQMPSSGVPSYERDSYDNMIKRLEETELFFIVLARK